MVGVWTPIAREALQSRLAGIDEDVQVPTRDVNQVGRDVLGRGIVIKFMVDDDPCADAVLAHHFQ